MCRLTDRYRRAKTRWLARHRRWRVLLEMRETIGASRRYRLRRVRSNTPRDRSFLPRNAIDHEALEEVEARHRRNSHQGEVPLEVSRYTQNATAMQVRHSQEVLAAEPALFRARVRVQ